MKDRKMSFYNRIVKRMLDIICSLAAIVCLSVLYLPICAIIKCTSEGPVFFRQKRIGKNKKYFNILKFRTMRIDTPKDCPTHLLKNPEQYITKVGAFLRKTSLDELPQIFNIFKGDMSVIGPRPALWNQDDLISERDEYGINDLKPGLTGWAQINGRDELPIPEKVQMDKIYRDNVSFVFDVKCLFMTVVSVFKHDGVVEAEQEQLQMKNNRKKVMILTNHSYMLYRFRKELIEELMKNYDVVLSMPFVGHHEDFINMGLRCIETKMERRGVNPIHDFSLMKFYKKILQEENPDLVITYSIKPNVYGGLMCEKLNIPFYANVQGLGTAFQKPGLAQFATVLYKTAFKKVKTVFFENQVNADEFVDRKIISVEKETILNGAGINLEIYECKPYPKSDPPHFLYLGRIMKEKGMDELFSAAEKLHDDGYKFVLDLVGFFEDEYKERVELLESKGVVKFHGFQEEPRPYYATADCVVMPSYHEGMSNVNLEASATGRPVITTDIPGCRESVENEYTGWLCEPKSVDSLYEKMKAFLETDISKREVMGKYARQKMVDEFDKKIVVNDTIKALKL